MSTILFLDFETGGLDSKHHAIVQAAWILEHDGKVIVERVFDVRPQPADDLCLVALEVNKFTLERLKAGKGWAYVYEMLKTDLLPYPDAWICGHNVQFDISFLVDLTKRACGEYAKIPIRTGRQLDTKAIACYFEARGAYPAASDHKLTTLCRHFNIDLGDKAHDALADIRATRELYNRLCGFYDPL